MSSRILNERFFYLEGSASGKNGFRWVADVGAGSREKRIAGRCVVDKLGRCCGATNPCFSKCDDVRFVVVGNVVKCGNMFGESIERVLRVQMRRFAGWVGPGLGWISS